MRKARRIIVSLLIIELIVVIPIIDRLLYGHSDPFVSHVIVPCYVLKNTGNLEDVVPFLAQAYHNINEKSWIWQIATASLIKDYVVGAPILLYTVGTVPGIDYKTLGYSPLVYFVYMLLFIVICLKIVGNSAEDVPRLYKFVILLALISVGLNFLVTYVFAHFIGFQYHAVALVMYLSIVLLFIKYLQSKQRRANLLVSLVVLYLGTLITHYRFPTLILGNVLLYTVFFSVLWIYAENPSYRTISKSLSVVFAIFLLLFYFQPFYWTQLKYKGANYLDLLFIFNYLSQILSGHREGGGALPSNYGIITAVQRYNIYLMFILWVLVVLILTLFTFRLSKASKSAFRREMFFLWGVGSTLIYDLTYFLHYHGLTGLSIYEAWIVGVSLSSFLMQTPRFIRSKLKLSLVALLIVTFSLTFMMGDFLTLYQKVAYPPWPDPSRYQADTSLSFLWGTLTPVNMGKGIVVGSSFPVSAELYEQTAKSRIDLLQHTGFVRIVNEVLEYNENGYISKFLNELQRHNDFLLITRYEEKYGLSTDVFGLKSYLLPLDIKLLKENFNQVYSSDLVSILNP